VPELDKNGAILDKALGRLQKEMDITINRVERLSLDDYYCTNNTHRPVPSTKDDKDPTK
jgi:hypothetical protein